MQRIFGLFATSAVLLCSSPAVVNAATTAFGPTPYLEAADVPANFYCSLCGVPEFLEDFEDNSLDSFLTIDTGGILEPFSTTGFPADSTDSVDKDDGVIDGDGSGGHSYFSGNVNMMTITFASPVTSAGLVFTDGDTALSDVSLEAFRGLTSLGLINSGDIADDFRNGTTGFGQQEDEDNFLGFKDADGITSLQIGIDVGTGIEIDHIRWQPVPEPASLSLALMGLIGLASLRRRRR